MKLLVAFVLFGSLLRASAQPDIIPEAGQGAQNDPLTGDLADNDDDDDSGGGNSKTQNFQSQSGQSAAPGVSSQDGLRHLSIWPPFLPPIHRRQCPRFVAQKKPKCWGSNSCSAKRCYRFKVTYAYYCGLKFFLRYPFGIRTYSCLKEHSTCGWGNSCKCCTKWCWHQAKLVIKHFSNVYLVKVWFHRPCGCQCSSNTFPRKPHNWDA